MGDFNPFEAAEPLTRRIANILQGYPDSTQIARELLQNSDDACSTVQWYLLDHHHHLTDSKQLFDPGMQAYQGPALLTGNDSLFELGNFKFLWTLAASGKKDHEPKIGKMGIGFHSVYHMTDTPSFISGDKMVILEPHMRIFRDLLYPGRIQESFTHQGKGMREFPGQLELFAAKEVIDFSQPYNGTIFRFPLRTEAQAEVSELSKSAYPTEMVRDMLMNLKNEAIKCLLFLMYIERMVIHERRESDPTVYKLFEIEIVNSTKVRTEKQAFMAQLKSHVYASDEDVFDKTLQYDIRPMFRLTHEDGTITEEEWAVVGHIGNVPKARQIMKEEYQADISNQCMIPWVGLATPVDPKSSVGTSNLFCFLPLGIHTPQPVHVNGCFAVKQSRREIWANYTDDISCPSTAGIKSNWNEFLFKRILPVAYARLLDSIGISHGTSYDLWPRSCEGGLGMESLWKGLLRQCLEEVTTNNDFKVLFADSADGEPSAVSYQMATIADPAMKEYPLLLNLLKRMVNLVCGVPENITGVLRQIVDATGVQDNILTPKKVRDLLREYKHSWKDSTSDDTKVEILSYCTRDDQIMDLEGLPLLLMADGSWVEFPCDIANLRYIINPPMHHVLQFADGVTINTLTKDTPATSGNFSMPSLKRTKTIEIINERDKWGVMEESESLPGTTSATTSSSIRYKERIQGTTSTAGQLLRAINNGRSQMHVEEIEPDDPSFQAMNMRGLTKALLDLNHDPLAFEPAKYSSDLQLAQEPEPQTQKVARYYIRLYMVTRATIRKYSQLYPADSSWAMAILSHDDLHNKDNPGDQEDPEEKIVCTLPYIGTTTASTPLGRFNQDQDRATASRLSNVLTCGKTQEGHIQVHASVFEWISLRQPGSTKQSIRTNPVFGNIERNLIALVHPWGLNSASGGVYYNWCPDSVFLKQVKECIHDLLSTPVIPVPGHATIEKSEDECTQSISKHFEDMWIFFCRLHSDNPGAVVNRIALQEIIADAVNNVTSLGKFTASVFITHDITIESSKGGFAYSSDAAGPGPRLEHHIRNVLKESHIRLPRTDLWSCTTQKTASTASIMFLSRYLLILRPLLIVSHSSTVMNILWTDCLGEVWKSTSAANSFKKTDASRLTEKDLSAFAHLDNKTWNQEPKRSSTRTIGSVVVVQYGPGPQDFALHIPERHTGSGKYNPATQNLFCEIQLLSKAIYLVALDHVSRRYRELEMAGDDNYLDVMCAIRNDIEVDINVRGLRDLFETKRRSAETFESQIMSARMKSFHYRNPGSRKFVRRNSYLERAVYTEGPPVDPVLLATLEKNDPFPSILESHERFKQWKRLMLPLYNAAKRGICPEVALCPPSTKFLSPEHRNWFLRLSTNKCAVQSAHIFGQTLRVNYPVEKREAFSDQRKNVGIQNTKGFDALDAMKKLAAPPPLKTKHNESFFQITCPICETTELLKYQNVHVCVTEEEEMVSIKPQGNLQNRRLYGLRLRYPHDVFDKVPDKIRQQIQSQGVFNTEDAANIIHRSHLPQFVKDTMPPKLGDVFFLPQQDLEKLDQWKVTMAVDRYLMECNQAEFTIFGRNLDESPTKVVNDCEYSHFNVDNLVDHIRLNTDKSLPVLTKSCDAKQQCDALLPHFPFSRTKRSKDEVAPTQAMHTCRLTGMDGPTIVNKDIWICSILDFPTPLARKYWHDIRKKEYHDTSPLDDASSNSYKILQWNVEQEIGRMFAAKYVADKTMYRARQNK
ncbi:hypothetical protein BGZ59_010179 [Podila verticillata]|nr:hypothetical protein BGZ59_010179 [Podila verticillata]